MVMNNPYSQYLENQFKTTSPGKLLILAYDAAIRFARAAREKMEQRKLDEQSANIRKAQNILLELMGALDPTADRQLAANLDALYTYTFDRLTQANIHDDVQALEEATQILSELRSAWAEGEIAARSGAGSTAVRGARAA